MLARSHIKGLLSFTALLTFVAVLPVLTHASDPASANWTKLSPATSPSARVGAAMAYDPVSKKIVLFGGFGGTYLKDTWTFDGTTWSKQQTPVAPPARTTPSMGFDKRTHKLVLFGGFNGKSTESAYLHDTWLWDGATSTWTEAKMTSPPPGASGPVVFTDPLTGRAIMCGGYDRFKKVPAFSKTWRWTGTAWHELHPTTSPIPRGWGIAVLDLVRKNVVFTGGDGDTIRTDNTWTWDGKNWTQQFPATQVPALLSAGIAFDPALQSVIVFGGWAGQESNQTWSWDGTNWVLLNPARSPSARDGMGMAYDSATHEIVMFGGEVNIEGKQLRDTWKWTGQ